MRITILAAAGFTCIGVFAACAQQPPPPDPDITIHPSEVAMIRQWVAQSALSLSMPDSTTHKLIDGTMILQFIAQRTEETKAAKAKEAAQKAKDEAPPIPAPATPLPKD